MFHARLLRLVREYGGAVALAKELGITDGTLRNWLNLKSSPVKARAHGQKWIHARSKKALAKLCQLCKCHAKDLFPDWIEDAFKVSKVVEFNTEVGATSLQDLREHPQSLLPSPETFAINSELGDRIDDVLKTLTYREREIVKLRYGLGDGRPYTLEECSRIFKLTRERTRQIEAKALRKLGHPIRKKMLQGFVEQPEEAIAEPPQMPPLVPLRIPLDDLATHAGCLCRGEVHLRRCQACQDTFESQHCPHDTDQDTCPSCGATATNHPIGAKTHAT